LHRQLPASADFFSARTLKEPQANPVRLLFYPAGGKHAVYDLLYIDSDCFRPFAGAVTVPFQIFLVIRRHMFEDSEILSGAVMKPPVGSAPPVILKTSIVVSVIRTSTLSLIY
jgi:hypothetical protein